MVTQVREPAALDLRTLPDTVRNQVQVIMRKLELKNRIQVAYLFGQQVNIAEITEIRFMTPHNEGFLKWLLGSSLIPRNDTRCSVW